MHSLILFLLVAISPRFAGAVENPDKLASIVRDQCVVNYAQRGTADPCIAVNTRDGYAILKDRRGASQFLLIATAPVMGVEDPSLLEAGAPPYWHYAWEARRYVTARLGRELDRSQISLAVNSAFGRSQRQLHIHIDCVAPAVHAALEKYGARITKAWSTFPVTFFGHTYRARRISRLDRPDSDPFRVVADGIPGVRHAMERESLLVVGATFQDGSTGFYVLETQARPGVGDRGAAEELQDHTCAIAHR